MRKHKGCIICKSLTQELDATGRCGSCSAVLRAQARKVSYGNLIALEATERAEKGKEKNVGKYQRNWETPKLEYDGPKISPVKDRPAKEKVCERCGASYLTKSNNAKHCPECRRMIQAEQCNARKKMYRMHKYTGRGTDGK